jgi:hypothetical protein
MYDISSLRVNMNQLQNFPSEIPSFIFSYENIKHVSQFKNAFRMLCPSQGKLIRYSYSLRGGRSGNRILVEGQILRTPPDRPCGPTNLLYHGYKISFLGLKKPRLGVDHQPHLASRLKIEKSNNFTFLLLTLRPVLGWTLSLPLHFTSLFNPFYWSLVITSDKAHTLWSSPLPAWNYTPSFRCLICREIQNILFGTLCSKTLQSTVYFPLGKRPVFKTIRYSPRSSLSTARNALNRMLRE